MTTDNTSTNVEYTQRSVRDLLKLKTYQGMTDAEIESIIEYHKDVARKDELCRSEQAAHIVQMQEWCAQHERTQAEANDILKKVLAAPLELATIDAEVPTEVSDNE